MGIKVEHNPDLALRSISEFKSGKRKETECIPDPLEAGKTYAFLKAGQRNYWLMGEIPLIETNDEKNYSKPKASVIIQTASHFVENGKIVTKGEYKVIDIFTDNAIQFNGWERVKR
jgi:hypothetical protein